MLVQTKPGVWKECGAIYKRSEIFKMSCPRCGTKRMVDMTVVHHSRIHMVCDFCGLDETV